MYQSMQLFLLLLLVFSSCDAAKKTNISSVKVSEVNSSYFLSDNSSMKLETVDCELSNGQNTKCLKIVSKRIPTDHKPGPWCPETIEDPKSKGGLWFKDGVMHEVDGAFIKNLAELYEDDAWLMYDEDGNVKRTKTKEDCEKLSGAQLQDDFINFCIECLPSYVADFESSFLIPLQPVLLDSPTYLGPPGGGKGGSRGGGGPGGPPGGGGPGGDRERPKGPTQGGGKGQGPMARGIALNGIVFDAPAPVDLILSGYTIPPLDHAGGHINMDAGYHYHAATGKSKQIKQNDGHAPLIGYASDGIGLYAYANEDGSTPADLDECRGHFDEIRGYHYHVDAAGANNFINCFSGAVAR